MVEITNLQDMDIYTIAGQYIGKIDNIVLNIRFGTVSKLLVKAVEPQTNDVGLRKLLMDSIQFVPEGEESKTFQDRVIDVDFDKVRAIGDIVLVDPQEIVKPNQSRISAPPREQTQVSQPEPKNFM